MADEEVNVAEIYGNVTSNLQTVLVAFLGFLILISVFIFFPYYFIVDTNKVVQNMDFLLNNIDSSLYSLKQTFTTYPDYANEQINFTKKDPSLNQNLENVSLAKNKINVTVNQELIRTANINITNMDKNLSKINSINDRYKVMSSIETDNIENEITKLKNFTENASTRYNVTMLEYENFLILLPLNVYPDSVEEKKIELNEEYNKLAEGVSNLQIPVVGSFPFNMDQIFLYFPAIIAIGFPFISMQWRKILILNKGISSQKKSLILSWLDPLQKWPDNAYSIIAIFTPLVIFLVFFISIIFLFYTNIGYNEEAALIDKQLLFLPESARNGYVLLNLAVGLSAFACSYYLIFSELLNKNNSKRSSNKRSR